MCVWVCASARISEAKATVPEQEAVGAPLALVSRRPGEVRDVVWILLQPLEASMWRDGDGRLDVLHQLGVGVRTWVRTACRQPHKTHQHIKKDGKCLRPRGHKIAGFYGQFCDFSFFISFSTQTHL